jgi:hypothetical protein
VQRSGIAPCSVGLGVRVIRVALSSDEGMGSQDRCSSRDACVFGRATSTPGAAASMDSSESVTMKIVSNLA